MQTEQTITQLTDKYNDMAKRLSKPLVKKFKDKPTAIKRLEAIETEYSRLPPIEDLKPKRERGAVGRFRFNYDVSEHVRPPKRGNTKFDMLIGPLTTGDGITMKELEDLTAEFTGEREPGAEQYKTTLEYRAWKFLNDLVKKHGYGMRWSKVEGEPIRAFDSRDEQDAWDAKHGAK